MKNLIIICLVGFLCISCKQNTTTVTKQRMPIDKNATKETVELYNRLFDLLDKGIMLGHQDDLAYGHSWYKEDGRSDVKDVTGDFPAVTGWELGHIEIGAEFNLDSVYFSDMKRYIKETHRRGGITTLSWHGDNIVTGNTAWDCAQDSVVRTILPRGANHEKYLTWLDRAGDFFLGLKDDNGTPIPVVFRMYHELTGGWFWWGNKQCTPEEFKQLWIMTVEYLRDKKNVHNLLYAYCTATAESKEEYFERYPGDEYADMIAFDIYAPSGKVMAEGIKDYQAKFDLNLSIITAYANEKGKLPSIGETGMESIPENKYFTEIVYPVINKYKVNWILFWRNAWKPDMPNHYYVPFEGHPSAPDFRDFVDKPNILMNKDIAG